MMGEENRMQTSREAIDRLLRNRPPFERVGAHVLESGDRGLIGREVTRIVEGMKSLGARYVFGSDHSLSTNVRYSDYLYAMEVYREHRYY